MEHSNDRKKILVFSTAFHPFVGGAEIAIKEISERLKNDFEFHLITARFDNKLPSFEVFENIKVYRIGLGRSFLDKLLLPFWGALKAFKLQEKEKFFCFWGVMVTFGSGAAYLCNLFLFLRRRETVPIVLTLQEGDSEEHLKYKWGGLIALSWMLALRNTKVLTGLSNFLLDRAQKNGYSGESFLVPNGVDLDLFSRPVNDNIKNNIKDRLGKKDGDIYLVTTSRLNYKNAVDDIISALNYLPKNISLIVIGKGEEGSKLQHLANSISVSSRVKFMGYVPYSDIPSYFSVCDIFIRPSRSEGFGNSFIEAMAARLPVIATPVGGIPDFIDDNETGIFCSVNNPQSIARAVGIFLEDRVLRDKIVDQAYRRVSDRYGWDTVSVLMKKAFDRVS